MTGICLSRKGLANTQSFEMANGTDHLLVLREKITQFREDIAHVQELNERYRREGRQGNTGPSRSRPEGERLQAIRPELTQFANLGLRARCVGKYEGTPPLPSVSR